MVEDALRSVVRSALETAAVHGLPGDHHFYITFRTGQAGVRIPDHLRARHPDEMTIVLQHQFWGLGVDDEAFEVTLSFGGVSERLHVPLAAITGFADPSAKFGLQFQAVDGEGYEDEGFDEDDDADADQDAAAAGDGDGGDGDGGGDAGKVVALDAFRKK